MSSSPTSLSLDRLRGHASFADVILWALLVVCVFIVVSVWYVQDSGYAWDDAFISFRYARNLANGDGLVWNPGGEHTQGYTNYLFVVLVAGGMKLGLSPLVMANVLNALGLLLIVITLGTCSRVLLAGYRRAWIIPPLALLFLPLIRFNWTTRMETVFWTGMVMLAIMFAQRAVQSQRRAYYLYGSLTLFFLAALTRPETILIAALIVIYGLIKLPATMRVHLAVATGIAGIAGLLYLVWANWYFGYVLPNSFYIKVSEPGALPGWNYVTDLLRYFAVLPMTYPGLIGLLLISRRQWESLVPYTSVFVLAIFYLFVSPFMGHGYRFLFPIVCLIDFLLATGLVALILQMRYLLFQRDKVLQGIVQRAGATVVLAVALAFLSLHFWLGGYLIWRGIASEDTPEPFANLTTIGVVLRDVEGIEQVKVAFGDAGKIAYYSDSQFLDVVGLNENTIAHEGNQQGADWVIRYVLDHHPDVIGFYAYPDGTVYQHEHGALGSAYFDLYTHPEFRDRYIRAGSFDSYWGLYAQLFIRADSPFADTLFKVLQNASDSEAPEILHP